MSTYFIPANQQSTHKKDNYRLIGNVLWFIFIGLPLGLSWWCAGIIMCLFVITIPWAKAAFTIGKLAFFPFGKVSMKRYHITGQNDIGDGNLGLIGNIIWLIIAGIWLAIHNVIVGCLFCLTIIGIPFGLQFFKLAKLSLWPIGNGVANQDILVAA